MADDSAEPVDPSDAFDVVGDENRLAIVRAVWDLTDHPGETVSFAALREEVGMRDSGQFNYHLGKLTPQFVRKVEAGYQLTEAGRRVVGAVVSGVYSDLDAAIDSRPAGDCPLCDGALELHYENGVLVVQCRDCERRIMDMSTPPVLVAEADQDDLPAVLGRHTRTEIQRMNRGFCVYCGGPLTVSTERRDDADELPDSAAPLRVEFQCVACDKRFRWTVRAAVTDHPAVVSLLYETGVDARKTPAWELGNHLDVTERIVSEDPVRVEATVENDAGRVTLTLDDSLDVVECERTTGADEDRG